jgi:hypothetical protein
MSLDDLDAAVLLFEPGLYTQSLFLASQAAEKALKAILVHLRERVPYIHNLKDILEQIEATVGTKRNEFLECFGFDVAHIASLIDQSEGLSKFRLRYPHPSLTMFGGHPYQRKDFDEYGAPSLLAVSACLVNGALNYLDSRRVRIQGWNRQQCNSCYSQFRPIYLCVRCFQWTCTERRTYEGGDVEECGRILGDSLKIAACAGCYRIVQKDLKRGHYKGWIDFHLIHPHWNER